MDYEQHQRWLNENRSTKASQPDGDWFTIDGKINEDKIHRFANDPVYADLIRDRELIRLLEDMDAGMCTMNGDTHTTEVPVSILGILISAYLRGRP